MSKIVLRPAQQR